MAYYLQMDGVDDKILAPSMTFDKIIYDVYVDSTINSASLRYLFQNTSGTAGFIRLAAGATSFTLGGGTATGAVVDTRTTLTYNATTIPSTAPHRICARADGALGFLGAKIYNIKYYNGASLVAHYDMNTQTVQDQTGNGNHATLTGGTWVLEGGGTDANVSSVVATATNDVLLPSVFSQISTTISSITATANSQLISPSVSTSSAVYISSAVATVSSSGISPSVSTGVNVTSILTNTAASAIPPVIGSVAITVNSVVASVNSQSMPPNVTIAHQVISVVNLEGVKTFIVPLQGSKEQTVQVLGLKDNIVLLEGEI